MPALRLGTRRSALARAQSGAVARRLEQLHPGLTVELVGIDTRGDRILDQPLSKVDGKEFFTAEIDAALLSGAVDFTVHSYKDLSLERDPRLLLAAVPRREQPRDLALFAPDVPERLRAGEPLRVGSSSPRRGSFVPDFLGSALPHRPGVPAGVQLVELRGNVDSRLRRLHEPRGSARHLDAVVLAFAGLARLWADESGRALLRELLVPLPRMLLPLTACPSAPAQGALAIECRREDARTQAFLASIDDPATRRAVGAERALLAERGGGCHQRFGATQIEVPGLGTLLHVREAHERPEAPQLHWTPASPLPAPQAPVSAWDGSQTDRAGIETLPEAMTLLGQRLASAAAIFVAHRRALPAGAEPLLAGRPVWVPGTGTWQALAERGVWVQGCAEGLGFAALEPVCAEPLLQLPAAAGAAGAAGAADWLVLTHAAAAADWGRAGLATYRHREPEADGPSEQAMHLYWHSGAQFDRWRGRVRPDAQHACGPGRTHEHLRRAQVQNLRMFPTAAHWRQWLAQ